jgi:hypothetical protein
MGAQANHVSPMCAARNMAALAHFAHPFGVLFFTQPEHTRHVTTTPASPSGLSNVPRNLPCRIVIKITRSFEDLT